MAADRLSTEGGILFSDLRKRLEEQGCRVIVHAVPSAGRSNVLPDELSVFVRENDGVVRYAPVDCFDGEVLSHDAVRSALSRLGLSFEDFDPPLF